MSKFIVNLLLVLPGMVYYLGSGVHGKDLAIDYGTSQEIQISPLDRASQRFINQHGRTVVKYAEQYKLDWRLVLAVVKSESQFQEEVVSARGARGLMQMLPVTQSMVAAELGLESESFNSPEMDIKGGVHFLAKIYKIVGGMGLSEENRIRFTLVAYCAGIGRLADAQKMASYMNDDPREWSSIKNSLSLLSIKYASLHSHVWGVNHPSNGYFRQGQMVAKYVETIMADYGRYRLAVPLKV
ncbi:MAG: transglycosylase SLT domain-containing protein [Ignavibacteriales bacterium]|nr:transglycosylase SLT domain-containing protein [Ignavibacteriales bacterium]